MLCETIVIAVAGFWYMQSELRKCNIINKNCGLRSNFLENGEKKSSKNSFISIWILFGYKIHERIVQRALCTFYTHFSRKLCMPIDLFISINLVEIIIRLVVILTLHKIIELNASEWKNYFRIHTAIWAKRRKALSQFHFYRRHAQKFVFIVRHSIK